jgi:uncharacterized protein (TIGR02646 family)
MYCRDSLSCDVEHFAPLSSYPDLTFQWPNLLWICAECNRKKGRRYPLSSEGSPLIIDPTRADPWKHFILDTTTGEVSARWLSTEVEDQYAATTLSIVATLSYEAVVEGAEEQLCVYDALRAGGYWIQLKVAFAVISYANLEKRRRGLLNGS